MSEILQSLTDPKLPLAMEANFTEEMTIWGRISPVAQLHVEQELLWFFSGKPDFNGVLLTHLASAEPSYIDSRIQSMTRFFQARHCDFAWSVGPSTYPPHLPSYLEKHGFDYAEKSIGLAVAIDQVHGDKMLPAKFTISEIEDRTTMQIKCRIERDGFGSTSEVAQNYYDGYCASSFGPNTCWHHYLGWLHSEPVAMASLLLHDGIAGIYGVATLPHARRQGFGTAMTYHTLHVAREQGYRIAALTATGMSQNIYYRMGFREYCQIAHYAWSPEEE